MGQLFESDLNNGRFTNPVLFADYSDPDVIRVNDTFYMTASSFNYVPGLPILTSKDLVNWKIANYALDNIPFENYKIPQLSKGVWAPALRYRNGIFYIYFGMPDEGLFMVNSENPLGKWEEPVCVLEGKGLIDCCPFWDDDGKAYIIHGYAKSRIGFKSCLGIFEMSPDGKHAVSEDHILYNGVNTQPTIEGPKVYKHNGMYYILAPAGGVKTGWQTALRGKSIKGPFEEKIVLRQGNSDINGPHQGGLVDDISGREWFVHFQDRGLYGRIIHVQPVQWKDGWPVMGVNDSDYCGEPATEYRKPSFNGVNEITYPEATDEFTAPKLGLMWQWLGNWDDSFYSLNQKQGRLRLMAVNPSGVDRAVLWERANVLTQKIVCPYFEAEAKIDYSGLKNGDMCGVVMMGGNYAYTRVRKEGDTCAVEFLISGDDGVAKFESVLFERKLYDEEKTIIIGLKLTEDGFGMFYGENREDIPESHKFMPLDHTWTGAKMGIFAAATCNENDGFVDVEYFKVGKL